MRKFSLRSTCIRYFLTNFFICCIRTCNFSSEIGRFFSIFPIMSPFSPTLIYQQTRPIAQLKHTDPSSPTWGRRS